MTRELPRFVRDLISSPPKRGGGLNVWLFRMALVLHPHRGPSEIVEMLRAATAGENVRHGEIERAVERSRVSALSAGDKVSARQSAWPIANQEQREAVIESGTGLVNLWQISSVRFEDAEAHTEQIVDALFPGDPLLCVGESTAKFRTRRRNDLRGCLESMQFIVASPMSRRTGRTQEGKESEHSLEKTGPRRFLVIEQDTGTADEQSAVLLHLAQYAPLALAVHSGSKSIHGWFYCAAQSEEQLRAFMRYAVTLGADPATWTRSQVVRMPDGTRHNGSRQTVYFFNPEVIQ
jgi:hypothetical protein